MKASIKDKFRRLGFAAVLAGVVVVVVAFARDGEWRPSFVQPEIDVILEREHSQLKSGIIREGFTKVISVDGQPVMVKFRAQQFTHGTFTTATYRLKQSRYWGLLYRIVYIQRSRGDGARLGTQIQVVDGY